MSVFAFQRLESSTAAGGAEPLTRSIASTVWSVLETGIMKASHAVAHFALVTILCSALGCRGHVDDISLQGSGATFPAPIYKRWFLDYYQKNPAIRGNYSPIGSGSRIRQFTSGLVMFGASDAGMSKKEVAALPKTYGGVLLLPMTAGCIVLTYNLPGVTKPILLSREAYVKIKLARGRATRCSIST